MRAVAATGYDGYLSLEIFNDQFRGGSPQIDRRRWAPLAGLPDGPGATRRSRHRNLRCPTAGPRRGRRASSSSSSRPTRQRREQLDRHARRHSGFAGPGGIVRRTSTLYRQGGINIVVNTEREGFAHSSYRRRMAPRPMRIGLRSRMRRRRSRAPARWAQSRSSSRWAGANCRSRRSAASAAG